MDAEETKKNADSAEVKPASKTRTARKPAARKSTAKAAKTAEPAATPAEKPARKPRAKKSPAPVAEAPATPMEAPAPKQKKNRNKGSETPQAAPEAAPAAAPKAEPTPAPAQPAVAEVKTAPAEQHKPEAPRQNQPHNQNNGQPAREQRWEREPDPRDFPAPEPAPGFAVPETVGGNEGGGNGKNRRKRRRNRRNRDNDNSQQQQAPSPKVDPDELVRRAWKIYLGEVTEEGLALMDDRTAAEASRRAFRVAELFLMEAARYRRPEPRPDLPQAPELEIEAEDDAAEPEAPAEF